MPPLASCGASAPVGSGSVGVPGVPGRVDGNPPDAEAPGALAKGGKASDGFELDAPLVCVFAGGRKGAASTRCGPTPALARVPRAAAAITPATISRRFPAIHTGARNHTSACAGWGRRVAARRGIRLPFHRSERSPRSPLLLDRKGAWRSEANSDPDEMGVERGIYPTVHLSLGAGRAQVVGRVGHAAHRAQRRNYARHVPNQH
jgi:hypothetical protein